MESSVKHLNSIFYNVEIHWTLQSHWTLHGPSEVLRFGVWSSHEQDRSTESPVYFVLGSRSVADNVQPVETYSVK